MKRILIVDDSHDDFNKIKASLVEAFGQQLTFQLVPENIFDDIKSGNSINSYLLEENFDLILLDNGLNQSRGIEASGEEGKSLYPRIPENIRKKVLLVSNIAFTGSSELRKIYFKKNPLSRGFFKKVENILSISQKSEVTGNNGDESKFKLLEFLSKVLIVGSIIYAVIFLVLSGKLLFEYDADTKKIVEFVESFFLVVLPIFMSYAIFIFVKKIVTPTSRDETIPPDTIKQNITIVNAVKNLFVGSIISYLSLSLVSDSLLVNNLPILESGGALIKLAVIALLIWFWKILSMHK